MLVLYLDTWHSTFHHISTLINSYEGFIGKVLSMTTKVKKKNSDRFHKGLHLTFFSAWSHLIMWSESLSWSMVCQKITEAQRYHCKYNFTAVTTILPPQDLFYCREFYFNRCEFCLTAARFIYCREFYFTATRFILLSRVLFSLPQILFYYRKFYFLPARFILLPRYLTWK